MIFSVLWIILGMPAVYLGLGLVYLGLVYLGTRNWW